MLNSWLESLQGLGKPEWFPMLEYTARLHVRAVMPKTEPFPHDFEQIGPGYCYGPAFGHWDIVHQIFDSIVGAPQHAVRQLQNNLALQKENGFLPGSVYIRDGRATWSEEQGHPPVWPLAVEALHKTHHMEDLLRSCIGPLKRQIDWFIKHRKAKDAGFYYDDILSRKWESGVDDGIRFDDMPKERSGCVDATSHVHQMAQCVCNWLSVFNEDATFYQKLANDCMKQLQNDFYDKKAGFFFDTFAMAKPLEQRPIAFEGMWPVVTGAATDEQANRLIDEYLLNEHRFFTKHPIATVAFEDPGFEYRMWRGPTWNSMTWWAAFGCDRYERHDAVKALLEAALDATASQYEKTGVIWEFYHPKGQSPKKVARKPYTKYNRPCQDYLGHNPLIAMAHLWQKAMAKSDATGIEKKFD